MDAEKYMEHWESGEIWKHLSWPRHQRRFRTIAGYCIGRSFLDVGCAYGHSTMNLKRYRPGAWSGCDFSESAIEKAKILFKDVRFYYCSSHDMLGEIGEKFDTVVCSEVLEHVPEDEQFASELVRIAEKRIVITTPRIKVDDPGHLRIYTRKTLSDLFPEKTAGIKEDGPFFYMVVVI